METTGRFDLPLIMPNQAQKHVTHNEALTLIDGLCHLVIKTFNETAPPATALVNDAFVVGTAATGDWFGEDGNVAFNTDVGWRFVAPRQGIIALSAATAKLVIYDQNLWKALDTALNLSTPTQLGINTNADTANRLALRSNAALLTAINSGDGGNGNMQVKINKELAANTASLLYQTGFSGRAELGLNGDDDLRIKVSPDGATWTDALLINKTTGLTTLVNNSIANAALADMPTAHFKARVSAGMGDPQDISGAQATTLLDTFTTTLKGLAPASGGGTTNFLRADGTWAAPASVAAATWGAITGTLSSQGDLATALAGKSDTSHTHGNATGSVAGFMAAADKSKLDAIASGATLNAADAALRDRSTHTGTQLAATISDLTSAISSNAAVAANTAKITNAIHTGDVTGATALTIAPAIVTNAKLANVATASIKGRVSAAAGSPEDLTGTQVTSLLDTFTTTLKGLAPASGGGTTNFLRADGTWAAPSGGGGAVVENGPARFYAFHDCMAFANTQDWSFTLSGTGAAHTVADFPDQDSIGALQSALGTVATNRTSITSPVFTVLQLGQGVAKWANRLRLVSLSDATNTWTLRSGFIDSLSAESTDGVFFRYTNGVNAGRFQAITRANGVETAVDTGITAALSTTYKLEVVVNAAGTSAAFSINGTLVATITTNIPVGNGREVGYGLLALRTVGTAAVNSYIVDYVLVDVTFTTGR